MSRRITQVVLLCEDGQHEAFARRFLKRAGFYARAIRVVKAPKGRGSGEQWVRAAYVQEVKAFRSANFIQGRALIVLIDEDTTSTQARGHVLNHALTAAGANPRSASEAILHVVPARNIETWLAYLSGETVDETSQYPRLEREGDCERHVAELKAMCDSRALRQPAPPSLVQACGEFRARLP